MIINIGFISIYCVAALLSQAENVQGTLNNMEFIVQLGPSPSSRAKLRFGPKMNTKVAFNTIHHRKLLRKF